jgi:hypothetical protein
MKIIRHLIPRRVFLAGFEDGGVSGNEACDSLLELRQPAGNRSLSLKTTRN